MPDNSEHIEELEKLVEENRKAFERAKRLLDEARRKAAQHSSDSASTVSRDEGQ